MFFRAADNTNPKSLASRLRRERMEALFELVEDYPEPVRILDAGGSIGFWKDYGGGLPKHCQITALNLDVSGAPPEPDFAETKGDARAMPQFGDKSFDICFSNSVIEHVGTLYDQMAMAREIRRVAKSYFVQTPNRYFPLEPHFLMPWWQYYPKALRRVLCTHVNMGWMKRQPDRLLALAEIEQVRLLNRYEMGRLFPDAEVRREQFGPLTKSLIAIRRASSLAAQSGARND